MDNNRINYKVFKWSVMKGSCKLKKWCYKVMEMLKSFDFERYCKINENFLDSYSISQLEEKMFDKYKKDWCTRIFSYSTGCKLRTYKLFKHTYNTEQYLLQKMPQRHRSAFSKFRCGVAPLKIETGRYERKNLDERVCFNCNILEDEKHVLLNCPLYEDLRHALFIDILCHNDMFLNLSDEEKFIYMFKNTNICNIVAKTCNNILTRRNSILYH